MSIAEALILDALRDERWEDRRDERRDERPKDARRREPPVVLLVGMQSCATVRAANDLLGSERVALLHLDRAAGGLALPPDEPGAVEVQRGEECPAHRPGI